MAFEMVSIERLVTLHFIYRSGLATAVVGFALSVWPSRDFDDGFFPRIQNPVFQKRGFRARPLIFIDEAHRNSYTTEGGLSPLVRLARAEGFRVAPNLRRFADGSLQGVGILVVARPIGWWGGDAFDEPEKRVISDWVSQGGGLLLSDDRSLSTLFGMEVTEGGSPGVLRVEPHGITAEISTVAIFSSRVLRHPAYAQPLAGSRAGVSAAVATEFGVGRVVVLSDTAMITARLGEGGTRLGINDSASGNFEFARRILLWLGRALPAPASE